MERGRRVTCAPCDGKTKMTHFPHILFAAKSDVGRKRKNNEDAFGMFPDIGVFCVADGMGGGDDGEVASAATVRAIDAFAKECPLPPNATYPIDGIVAGIRKAVSGASLWIYERAKKKGLKGCGSTFVGVCLDAANPNEAVALHAGDSRLYHIRGGRMRQVTKDHSAAELIGAKDENELNPMFRGMILRAVGIQPKVEIERTELSLKENDWILICSDGLTKMVSDKKILKTIRTADNAVGAVEALVNAANDNGGLDNVTVVLLKIGKLPPPLPASLFVPKSETTATTIAKTEESTALSSVGSVGSSGDVMFDEESSGGVQIAEAEGDVADVASEDAADTAQPQQPSAAKRLLTFVEQVKNRRIIVSSVLSVAVLAIVATGTITRDHEEGCLPEEAAADFPATMMSLETDRKEEEARRLAEEEARRKAEEARKVEEARRKAEAEARRKAEEEARLKAEEEVRRLAEEEARRKAEAEARRQALNSLTGVCIKENLEKVMERLQSTGAVESQELMTKFYDQALRLSKEKAPLENRERLAGELVETMRSVADQSMNYGKYLKEYFNDEIRDDAQTWTAERRKEVTQELDKLEKFISHAQMLTDGSSPSVAETYRACAWLILNIPRSF